MCAHTHTHTPQATLEGSTPLGEEEQKKKKDGTTEEEASPREVVNFTRKRFFSPLSLSRFSIVSDAAAVGHFGLFSHFDPSTTRSDQHKNGSDVAAASRPALVEGGNENAQLKLVRWLQADPCYSILFCSFFLYISVRFLGVAAWEMRETSKYRAMAYRQNNGTRTQKEKENESKSK